MMNEKLSKIVWIIINLILIAFVGWVFISWIIWAFKGTDAIGTLNAMYLLDTWVKGAM